MEQSKKDRIKDMKKEIMRYGLIRCLTCSNIKKTIKELEAKKT